MWYVAEFQPTTLFSLRPANATTSGGKTLITPTPFAVKMALLDVALRIHGHEAGEAWFPRLRDLKVAVRLPEQVMVINTFVKILRPHKNGPKDTFGTGLVGPMGNTIAYRELVHFGGSLSIAVEDVGEKGLQPPLEQLFCQIHYLGKRGSFMQFRGCDQRETLDGEFTLLNPEANKEFTISGMLQLLDDCGPKMSFSHADVYSDKTLSIGKENGRLLKPVVLPYRPVRSSKAFTLYQYQVH